MRLRRLARTVGLSVIGALLTALLLAVEPGRAAGPDTTVTITIAGWGGAYETSQRKAYFEPFEKLNPGIKIKLANAGGEQVAGLREQTRSGTITWDLMDVTASDAVRLCREQLLLPFKHDAILSPAPDGTPAREDFGQTLVSDCFIPEIVYATTFAYRTDLVKEKPTDLCSIFDLARFPGKRSLEKRPINNLEWALVCDGVVPEKIYETLDTEEGLQRAFRKLDSIKSQIVWWTEGHETPDRLARGEVVFGSAYNGRLFNLVARKRSKVAMLWDRQMFDFDGWVIPKGGHNIEAVLKFVRFATDTERLADQARYIPYGPARRSSTSSVGSHASLGIDMKPYLPTAPENAATALIFNYDWWAANRDRLDERFRQWLDAKS